MSKANKFHNPEGLYFVSFATVEWVDVFTRRMYRDVVIESLKHCQAKKGLVVYAWCIMSHHVHLIVRASGDNSMPEIMRDMKKFTSKQIIKMIQENHQESRREWMLRMFQSAGANNSNNKNFQFWRQDNKPIELFTHEVIQQKLDYIHNNPVVEGLVDSPEHYMYSSAYGLSGKPPLLDTVPM